MASEAAAIFANGRFARRLFVLTIITGSFLLFLTQPMIARMALPRLGGAPAVWNSAMLVYQALLLAGYAYAHWLARLRPRVQAGLHLSLFGVAALWLPIGLGGVVPPVDFEPTLWVPWFLLTSIGPLFFIVSAQAPLMQRWYALDPSRGEPYPLYAASNLGSFAGLIAYPLIVEPFLTLEQQSLLWSGGYALLILLVALSALTIPSHAAEALPAEEEREPIGGLRIAHWIALAAIPSGLMLSTTTHLTTDIVAMPLIWVIPLGLYLLSYVVAFADSRRTAEFLTQLAPFILVIAGGLAFANGSQRPISAATLGLSLLFLIAVALHGELYRLRPRPSQLTTFYLALSTGGVFGGAFCAIAAPLVFDWVYEHPILILGAALLLPGKGHLFPIVERLWVHPERQRLLRFLLPSLALLLSAFAARGLLVELPKSATIAMQFAVALIALLTVGRRFVFTACVAAMMLAYGGWEDLRLTWLDVRTRSYFGIYSVGTNEDRSAVTLTHGTTLHGVQNLGKGRVLDPTTYYVRESGAGFAFTAAPILFGPNARIGVVGLGTGTLACYAIPGQRWSFFEIDPAIVRVANESGYFTFLKNCTPDARIVLGDARLTLAREQRASFNLLAIDAFSSDAVPMHLLTAEAFEVYGRALQSDGILLVHISNRYLDLEPVVAAAARGGGWHGVLLEYIPDVEAAAANASASVWIALSRNQDKLDDMLLSSGRFAPWQELKPRPGFRAWTDDHASILPLIEGWTE